jgi:hypothetical protein
MVVEHCFDDGQQPWIVTNERTYRQSDGFNCGPIACLKVMELYGFLQVGSIPKIGESIRGYRSVVMEYYNQAVIKYDRDLKMHFRTKIDDERRQLSKESEAEM